MNMPGYSAESSINVPRGARSGAGALAPGRSADVAPARPCCSACYEYCAEYPGSQWCNTCRGNCTSTC